MSRQEFVSSGVCLVRSLSFRSLSFQEFVFPEFVFQEFVTAPIGAVMLPLPVFISSIRTLEQGVPHLFVKLEQGVPHQFGSIMALNYVFRDKSEILERLN